VASISPDVNPLHYHVCGAMLTNYHKHQPKPMTTNGFKAVLQTVW